MCVRMRFGNVLVCVRVQANGIASTCERLRECVRLCGRAFTLRAMMMLRDVVFAMMWNAFLKENNRENKRYTIILKIQLHNRIDLCERNRFHKLATSGLAASALVFSLATLKNELTRTNILNGVMNSCSLLFFIRNLANSLHCCFTHSSSLLLSNPRGRRLTLYVMMMTATRTKAAAMRSKH